MAWLQKELADKLNKVTDYLLQSIENKDETLESLESRIAEKTKEIDVLKEKKRDLEIDLANVAAKNKRDREDLEAGWNREKQDINHLVKLREESAAQKAEHDKAMLEVSYTKKEAELERKFNEKYKTLVEQRDQENKTLLAAHMKDIKELTTTILNRLPNVTAAFNKSEVSDPGKSPKPK